MIGAALAMRATRRSFAALNRGDLATFMSGVSDDAVFEFPGRTVVSGSHRGADAIRSWYGAWFSQMPSRRFTIKKIAAENGLAMGSSNSVLVEWHLDEEDRQGRWFGFDGVTSITIRHGRAVFIRDYIADQHALEEIWGFQASE